MSVDLIKSFLVGLGFEIDKSSLHEATQGMDNIEKKVRDFNDSSNEGFSETSDSLKGLFSLLTSTNTLGSLFPGLRKPLKNILSDVKQIKKYYDDLSDSKKDTHKSVSEEIIEKKSGKETVKNVTKKKVNTLRRDAPKVKSVGSVTGNLKAIGSASADTTSKISGLKKELSSLLSKGGGSIKALATGSVASLAVIAVAVVAAIAAIAALVIALKKLASYLNKLAEKDIGYEKLSRTLWTTKQTAKEVSQALDILGASMEDLWLSPTLLKQFNQLRKDASAIRIPPEFQENLKLVQDLGFEFKRFKQLLGLLFEWIGHYILDALKGPLGEFKGDIQDINTWFMDNIPKIAKVIGTAIGIFLKFLYVIIKVLSLLWKLGTPIWGIIKLIGKVGEGIYKLSDGTRKAARIILTALAFAFSPLLLVIALIDDILTFMRGGKSVIGDVIDYVSNKFDEFIDRILGKFEFLRKIFNFSSDTKDEWSSYYERASESLDKIKNKAKEVLGGLRGWSRGIFEKGKDFLKGGAEKIVRFEKEHGNGTGPSVAKSYSTNNNSSTRTTNNSNEVRNKNTINVYGNDANATGNIISKRLTGITSRNLQGGIV